MSAQPSFFSQAYNFSSAVSGGVDPRTGQYNINLNLAKLVANNQLGPSLPLELSYSPTMTDNLGFGIGFSFGLTQFDRSSGLLNLSNGEQYYVDQSGSSLEITENKLKSVSIEKAVDCYRVTYRDGTVEVLTGPDMAGSLKLTQSIVSPDGHFVRFQWDSADRLTAIVDEAGTSLLAINYPNSQNLNTEFSILPGQTEGYNIFLTIDDGYLQQLQCDALGTTDNSLIWIIEYSDMRAPGTWNKWATKLVAPGGLTEEAIYVQDSAGHQFPSSFTGMQNTRMPYVTSFTTTPGGGQAKMLTTYSYSDNNFLGYASGVMPQTTSDPLYNCTFDYQYSSVETHSDEDGVQTTVTRTYNCFHLLVKKETARRGHVVSVETVYYATPGTGFKAQVPQFQSPQLQTTTWSLTTQKNDQPVTLSRAQKVATNYDDFGNLLSQEMFIEDDTDNFVSQGKTTREYYPAAGETDDLDNGTGCPSDPNLFNVNNDIPCHLRRVTTMPGQSDYADTSNSITTYRFAKYDFPTQTKAVNDSYTLFNVEERHLLSAQLLAKIDSGYADAGSEFGRLNSSINTHYPAVDHGKPTDGFAATTTMTTTIVNDQMVRSTTVTTHDGITTTNASTASRFTGKTIETVDAMGVKTQAEYDPLGRVISQTKAADTVFANKRTFDYAIGSLATMPYIITATDALSNQARVSLDAVGSAIKGEIKVSHKQNWQTLQTRTYDNAGRLASATNQDFEAYDTAEDDFYASLTTTQSYDDWGRVYCRVTPNGVKYFKSIDPITLTQTSYSESSTQDPATGQPLKTSKTITKYDVAHRQIVVQFFARDNPSDDNPDYLTTSHYDGLNRLRSSTDAVGHTTTFVYDAFGRTVKTTLPAVVGEGNTIVARTYSSDTPATTLTDIQVNTVSMGTRVVDGLGRITRQTSGGRTLYATYTPISGSLTAPASITSAYRTTVNCYYQPELGGKLIRTELVPIPGSTDLNMNCYDRDPVTAALTSAKHYVKGRVTTSLQKSYEPTGRLSSETFSQGGGATKYSYTTAGKLWSYTDVTGIEQKVTTRDLLGRPTRVTERDVQLDLSYDILGRLYQWKATDLTVMPQVTLTTTIEWDTLDRESRRTVASSEGKAWCQEYSYYKNHHLKSKSLKRGVTGADQKSFSSVREESYQYDARNRLTIYACGGSELVKDSKGLPLIKQSFAYDAYNNIKSIAIQYQDGSTDTITCLYSTEDICQLKTVTHTHKAYPAQTDYSYDAAGCLIDDGTGRTFTYDTGLAPGYLRSVTANDTTTAFIYDPLNRLIQEGDTSLYYRGAKLVNQIDRLNNKTRFVPGPQGNLAQVREGTGAGVWLSGADAAGSILSMESNGTQQTLTYGPYGEQDKATSNNSILGYNGERKSNVLDGYHLGNGYRLFSPALRRFTSPDNMSPFGKGGINPYVYCAGDPINNTDPTGHHFLRKVVKHEIKRIEKHVKKTVKTIEKTVANAVEHPIRTLVVVAIAVTLDAATDGIGDAFVEEGESLTTKETAEVTDKKIAKGAEDASSPHPKPSAPPEEITPSAPPEEITPSAPPEEIEPSAPPEEPQEPKLEHQNLQGTDNTPRQRDYRDVDDGDHQAVELENHPGEGIRVPRTFEQAERLWRDMGDRNDAITRLNDHILANEDFITNVREQNIVGIEPMMQTMNGWNAAHRADISRYEDQNNASQVALTIFFNSL